MHMKVIERRQRSLFGKLALYGFLLCAIGGPIANGAAPELMTDTVDAALIYFGIIFAALALATRGRREFTIVHRAENSRSA
jgi:hypothetical protein